MQLKQKLSDYWEKAKYYLRTTSCEIALGIVLGGIINGNIDYNYEVQRSRIMPLGFSEITQREHEADRAGKGLGPLNQFYPKLNDTIMKPLEARNNSYASSFANHRTTLAKELEYITEPTFKTHHYNEAILLKQLPAIVSDSLKELEPLRTIEARLKPIIDNLNHTWKAEHEKVFRTEIRTKTVHHTDSQGHDYTTTETEVVQVYDHTHHTYEYNRDLGQLVALELGRFVRDFPDFQWPEELTRVKETNAEGEYAAEKSRNKGVRLSRAELLDIANEPITFATYGQNKPTITENFRAMPKHRKKWDEHKTTAHDDAYNTYLTSDDGPKEYQTIVNAKQSAEAYCNSLDEIVSGLQMVAAQAPQLQRDIENYIHVVLDNQKGNPRKIEEQIMNTVVGWSNANFSGKTGLEFVRWELVALWTLLGMGIGGGLGKLLDRTAERRNWWEPKRGLHAENFIRDSINRYRLR